MLVFDMFVKNVCRGAEMCDKDVYCVNQIRQMGRWVGGCVEGWMEGRCVADWLVGSLVGHIIIR